MAIIVYGFNFGLECFFPLYLTFVMNHDQKTLIFMLSITKIETVSLIVSFSNK